MSTSVYIYSFFGLRIPKKDFYTKKKVKIGKHNYSKDDLFNPKTGEPLWKTEEVPAIYKYYDYDTGNKKQPVIIFDENKFNDDFVYIVDRNSMSESGDIMYNETWDVKIDKNQFTEQYEKAFLVVEKFMDEQAVNKLFDKNNFGFFVKCNIG